MALSLQEQYAPQSICFGCGPANKEGLHLKSHVQDDIVTANFTPAPHHHAFPNVLCGGIIGTLLDCHCNWAACYFLMKDQNLNHPPCTVTADYAIKLKRPIPMDTPLVVYAILDSIEGSKAIIKGRITIDEKVYATCNATFVAVKQDHPAYHRW